MLLTFRRTGERRYAVTATRGHSPDLEMNPAPGYDPFLPHDILHLVVEAVTGLKQGVFGQLAAGGDAGTFHIKAGAYHTPREEARERRRLKKRGMRLAQSGADDSAQSEQATYVCWQEWLSRSDSKLHQKQAQAMVNQARYVRESMPQDGLERLDAVMDSVCQHLDVISTHWHRLGVGEAIQVRWPDLSLSIID